MLGSYFIAGGFQNIGDGFEVAGPIQRVYIDDADATIGSSIEISDRLYTIYNAAVKQHADHQPRLKLSGYHLYVIS